MKRILALVLSVLLIITPLTYIPTQTAQAMPSLPSEAKIDTELSQPSGNIKLGVQDFGSSDRKFYRDYRKTSGVETNFPNLPNPFDRSSKLRADESAKNMILERVYTEVNSNGFASDRSKQYRVYRLVYFPQGGVVRYGSSNIDKVENANMGFAASKDLKILGFSMRIEETTNPGANASFHPLRTYSANVVQESRNLSGDVPFGEPSQEKPGLAYVQHYYFPGDIYTHFIQDSDSSNHPVRLQYATSKNGVTEATAGGPVTGWFTGDIWNKDNIVSESNRVPEFDYKDLGEAVTFQTGMNTGGEKTYYPRYTLQITCEVIDPNYDQSFSGLVAGASSWQNSMKFNAAAIDGYKRESRYGSRVKVTYREHFNSIVKDKEIAERNLSFTKGADPAVSDDWQTRSEVKLSATTARQPKSYTESVFALDQPLSQRDQIVDYSSLLNFTPPEIAGYHLRSQNDGKNYKLTQENTDNGPELTVDVYYDDDIVDGTDTSNRPTGYYSLIYFPSTDFRDKQGHAFKDEEITRFLVNPSADKTLNDIPAPVLVDADKAAFDKWKKIEVSGGTSEVDMSARISSPMYLGAAYLDILETDPHDSGKWAKVRFQADEHSNLQDVSGKFKDFWVLKSARIPLKKLASRAPIPQAAQGYKLLDPVWKDSGGSAVNLNTVEEAITTDKNFTVRTEAVFDKEYIRSVEITKLDKRKYIEGDNFDPTLPETGAQKDNGHVVVRLTDTHGNTQEVSYDKFSEYHLSFTQPSVDSPLTRAEGDTPEGEHGFIKKTIVNWNPTQGSPVSNEETNQTSFAIHVAKSIIPVLPNGGGEGKETPNPDPSRYVTVQFAVPVEKGSLTNSDGTEIGVKSKDQTQTYLKYYVDKQRNHKFSELTSQFTVKEKTGYTKKTELWKALDSSVSYAPDTKITANASYIAEFDAIGDFSKEPVKDYNRVVFKKGNAEALAPNDSSNTVLVSQELMKKWKDSAADLEVGDVVTWVNPSAASANLSSIEPKVTPGNGKSLVGWMQGKELKATPLSGKITGPMVLSAQVDQSVIPDIDGKKPNPNSAVYATVTLTAEKTKGSLQYDGKPVTATEDGNAVLKIYVDKKAKKTLGELVTAKVIVTPEPGFSLAAAPWRAENHSAEFADKTVVSTDLSYAANFIDSPDVSPVKLKGYIEVSFKKGAGKNLVAVSDSSGRKMGSEKDGNVSYYVNPVKSVRLSTLAPQHVPQDGYVADPGVPWQQDGSVAYGEDTRVTAGSGNTYVYTARYVSKIKDAEGDTPPQGFTRIELLSGKGDFAADSSQTGTKTRAIDVYEDVAWNDTALTQKISGYQSGLTPPKDAPAFTGWSPAIPQSGLVKDSKEPTATKLSYTAQFGTDISATPLDGYKKIRFIAGANSTLSAKGGVPYNTETSGELTVWVNPKANISLGAVTPIITPVEGYLVHPTTPWQGEKDKPYAKDMLISDSTDETTSFTSQALAAPKSQDITVDKDETPDAARHITNKHDDGTEPSLPAGTKFSYVDEDGSPTAPSTSKGGESTVHIKVKYPDESFKIVEAKLKVRTDAEKFKNDHKDSSGRFNGKGTVSTPVNVQPKIAEVNFDPALPTGASLKQFNGEVEVSAPTSTPIATTGTVVFADKSEIADFPIEVSVVASPQPGTPAKPAKPSVETPKGGDKVVKVGEPADADTVVVTLPGNGGEVVVSKQPDGNWTTGSGETVSVLKGKLQIPTPKLNENDEISVQNKKGDSVSDKVTVTVGKPTKPVAPSVDTPKSGDRELKITPPLDADKIVITLPGGKEVVLVKEGDQWKTDGGEIVQTKEGKLIVPVDPPFSTGDEITVVNYNNGVPSDPYTTTVVDKEPTPVPVTKPAAPVVDTPVHGDTALRVGVPTDADIIIVSLPGGKKITVERQDDGSWKVAGGDTVTIDNQRLIIPTPQLKEGEVIVVQNRKGDLDSDESTVTVDKGKTPEKPTVVIPEEGADKILVGEPIVGDTVTVTLPDGSKTQVHKDGDGSWKTDTGVTVPLVKGYLEIPVDPTLMKVGGTLTVVVNNGSVPSAPETVTVKKKVGTPSTDITGSALIQTKPMPEPVKHLAPLPKTAETHSLLPEGLFALAVSMISVGLFSFRRKGC